MAKVFYKSVIPNDKPQWLLNVQQAVREAVEIMTLQGDERDFKNLKSFIDAAIQSQRSRGILTRSDVHTDLLTDEGRTVIRIFRNRDLIQTYFIE